MNLEKEYELIKEEIKNYRDWTTALVKRFTRSPIKVLKFSYLTKGKNPLTNVEDRQFVLETLNNLVLKKEEVNTKYSKMIYSPYEIYELSLYIENKYPNLNYELLFKHIYLWKTDYLLNSKGIIGFVLLIASTILNFVPEPLLGKYYDDFQIYVFWILIVTLFYIVGILAFPFYSYLKEKNTRYLTDKVIEHIVIRREIKNQHLN